MTYRSPRAAVLTGLGSWLPPDTVTNADLEATLDTNDAWIRSRTGIANRHRVSPGMSTSDLAVEAGLRALKSARSDQADAVVLATSTPDELCPATAPDVASRIGLPGVAAFDVSAVCAGFVYGLATAAGLIATGVAERVLLIGAEAFTTLVDPADRTTAAIFGDGAGAVVLRAGDPDEPGALISLVLGSDGGGSELLTVPAGGARRREPTEHHSRYLTMQGREIFRFAVRHMTSACRTAAEQTGWPLSDIDRLVAHQANARISNALGDALGVPPESRASNIEHVGNTASASIPLLLDEDNASGALTEGQRVLITAFGGGLAWGAATLVWPSLTSVA
ncbi:beta-ketoacyl-ACP synthase III [Streptomyces sp. NBC_00878]|uniref:beta-ketoacyl-ACP synthase III n=1 Tax=Streptomyces sp. NBC_00878 TaxID=2975854 RepID=UPI00225AA81D|nr:beta-ketoacyl-ACP synthase III [Streptomyces sp. NBC_00878]MCX4903238.1 ketoacyl-ACP synthase III [Streptomyces sp. NBC_00878]